MAQIPTTRGNPQASDIAVESALPMVGSLSREDLQTTLGLVDAELAKLFEDRNAWLTGGGIISNNSTGTSLSFTANFTLYVNQNIAGSSPYAVSIGSSPWAFSADGRMAYVVINRTGASGTLTTDAATLPAATSANQEVFLLAKRVGTDIVMRNGQTFSANMSAALGRVGTVFDNEFVIKDASDSSIQIDFNAAGSTSTKTTIASSQTANRVVTLPDITDTLVSRTNTEALSNKQISYSSANDASATGSNATLSAISTGVVRLTNGSLASVSGIPNGASGKFLIVENKTGNAIVINNDDSGASANDRIFTGSGGNVSMPNNATFAFTYDATSNKWHLTGGSGSGNGGGSGKNYLSAITTSQSSTPNTGNGNFEFGSTTGWSLGTTGTLTNGLPTGTPTFGSGASGNLSIAPVSSGQLAGSYSLSYASSAATTQGNMLASDAFYIDTEDQAKVLTWKFYYKAQTNPTNANWSGTSSNSFGVAVYDVTNSTWLPNTGNFAMTQNSGVGIATGSFQTAINTAQLRFVVYNVNATAGAVTVYFDDFVVGPQSVSQGSPETDWRSFTPTTTWTTNTTATGLWKRTGDMGHFQIRLAFGGAPDNTTLYITLPFGLSIDTAKLTSSGLGTAQLFGHGITVDSGNRNSILIPTVGDTASRIFVYALNNTAGGTGIGGNTTPFAIGAGDFFEVKFSVPIVGWSSNVQMSNDTDTRVVSCVAYRATDQTGVNPNSSNVKVNFSAADRDTHGAFDTPNSRYIIPVSGEYLVEAYIRVANSNVLANAYQALIFKNGSIWKEGQIMYPIASGFFAVMALGRGALKAGDIIEVYLFGLGNNSVSTLTLPGGTDKSTLSITRVSGPSVIAASESVNARYLNTAGTSIPNTGTHTSLPFATKDYDSHNAYNGTIFTAPVSGKYEVHASILSQSATWSAGNFLQMSIYKNGSVFSFSPSLLSQITTITGGFGDRIFSTLNLNAGDTIEIRAAQTRTGGSISLNTSTGINYVEIKRIGN